MLSHPALTWPPKPICSRRCDAAEGVALQALKSDGLAMQIITTIQPTQSADGTHASVATSNDTYFVEAGGGLSATGEGANGIHAVSGHLTAFVLGSVSARQWGIYAAGQGNQI